MANPYYSSQQPDAGNLYVSSYSRLFSIMPAYLKKKSAVFFGLLLTNSLLDIIGLGIFIPVFSILFKSSSVSENQYLSFISSLLGIESYNSLVVVFCLVIFAVMVLKSVFNILIARYQANFAYNLVIYLSTTLLRATYQQGFQYIKQKNSNAMMWEVNDFPVHLVNFLALPLFNFTNELIVLLLILGGIIAYDFKVVLLLAVVLAPVMIIFYQVTKNKIERTEKEYNFISPKVHSLIQQMFHGFSDMMITGTENYFFKNYHQFLQKRKSLLVDLYVFRIFPSKILEVSIVLGIILLVLYAVIFLKDASAILSLLGLFSLASFRVLPSINRIVAATMSIKSYQYTLDHIVPIIEEVKSFPASGTTQEESISLDKEIALDNISFAYTDEKEQRKNVLNGISFKVAKGETVGIIGRSGSGKTTLINILLRFLNEDSGHLKVDGVTLSKKNERSWRSMVGYVQQDVFLLDATIKENIAFGIEEEKIDNEKLNEVIEKASLKELVQGLPEGVNTRVGERGALLSGGQKQRIAIARALYKGVKVLIFDEATSALDNETEKDITQSINSLSAGRDITIIIIAHRVTTLKYCDRIIELENGSIKRSVAYEQLVKENVFNS